MFIIVRVSEQRRHWPELTKQ